MPPMTGRVIAGRYNLAEPIGRGAMGVVWRARDLLLDRDVAVKEVVLNVAIGEDERQNAYQRTLREARTAARLSHRGVVTVYDVAEEDGRPWIVMELVESRSLDQILSEDGPVTPRRAGRIGQQLLSALAAAHAAGVLHRDVKPSNVLIATEAMGAERAVLTDFGIAQFEGDPRLTQTGMVMGSPGFTAPERIRGGSATPASDLWSLGATIYAAVEGRGPYEQRGGAITTMTAIINEDAPSAPSAGRLAPVIAALLRREPTARPPAMAAARMFAEALPSLPDQRPGRTQRTPSVLSTSLPVPPSSARAGSRVPPPSPVPAPSLAPRPVPARVSPLSHGASAPPGAKTSSPPPATATATAKEQAPNCAAAEASSSADALAEGEVTETAVSADAASKDAAPKSAAPSADTDAEVGAAEVNTAEASAAAASAADAGPAGEPATAEATAGEASGDGGIENLAVVEVPGEETIANEQVGKEPAPADAAADADLDATVDAAVDAVGEIDALPGEETLVSSPAVPIGDTPPAGETPPASEAGQANDDSDAIGEAVTEVHLKSPAQPAAGLAQDEQTAAGAAPSWTPGSWRKQPRPSFSPAEPASPVIPATRPQSPYSSLNNGPNRALNSAPHNGPSIGPAGYAAGARPRRRRRGIAALAAAIVVVAAVAIVTVILLNKHTLTSQQGSGTKTTSTGSGLSVPGAVQALDNPAKLPPAGWSMETVPSSLNATNAGFSIGLPPGWSVQQNQLATNLLAPDNVRYAEIDLTPHKRTNMIDEANYIATNAQDEGNLPGYKQIAIQRATIRGTAGAYWAFTWVANDGVTMEVNDLLFVLDGQSYALYFTAPATEFASANGLPLFEQMLRTFEPYVG
ncbi:MAG TPA: serine/threonine-protein kinase [Trebonia sp.]|jgi:serine/threonine protein kinase|nr:serine/threonine-protein kinase [Trebonia sp.]